MAFRLCTNFRLTTASFSRFSTTYSVLTTILREKKEKELKEALLARSFQKHIPASFPAFPLPPSIVVVVRTMSAILLPPSLPPSSTGESKSPPPSSPLSAKSLFRNRGERGKKVIEPEHPSLPSFPFAKFLAKNTSLLSAHSRKMEEALPLHQSLSAFPLRPK